jgi:hypothetical protein
VATKRLDFLLKNLLLFCELGVNWILVAEPTLLVLHHPIVVRCTKLLEVPAEIDPLQLELLQERHLFGCGIANFLKRLIQLFYSFRSTIDPCGQGVPKFKIALLSWIWSLYILSQPSDMLDVSANI